MLRLALVAVAAAIAGAAGGAAGWYTFGPLLQTRAVDEPLPPEFSGRVEARGTFRDGDARHRGRGSVRLLVTERGTQVLRFEGFAVTNGPDLKVWLVDAPAIRAGGDVKAAAALSLGPLKGNIGNQTYILPAGIDTRRYGGVVVWCEAFGVLFSAADLER
ncbi:DM13 domain-containing protein [Prosthecomicrobium sp. N25]|uniref:DM13 domain-containing protein n=1 Tax=Prosthecomicrobium sp. N25 TaxID=3129254 RepID=UPI00307788D2